MSSDGHGSFEEFDDASINALLMENPSNENLTEYSERLKLCIRWYKRLQADKDFQLKGMQSSIDACNISISHLQAELLRVTTERNSAVESYDIEKLARLAIQRLHAELAIELLEVSLDGALEKTGEDFESAKRKIDLMITKYNNSAQYNAGVRQLYNRLQVDSETVKDLLNAEKERTVIVEKLKKFKGGITLLQGDLGSLKGSSTAGAELSWKPSAACTPTQAQPQVQCELRPEHAYSKELMHEVLVFVRDEAKRRASTATFWGMVWSKRYSLPSSGISTYLLLDQAYNHPHLAPTKTAISRAWTHWKGLKPIELNHDTILNALEIGGSWF